jgi:hypothetical protein
MELFEFDLVDYCKTRRLSEAKLAAAQEFLRDFERNLKANPAHYRLNRFFDKKLIAKVRELAVHAAYFRETGLDRIESELLEHAQWNDWLPYQDRAGFKYLSALRTDPQAARLDELLDEDIAFIQQLVEKYPAGFRALTRV